MDRHSPSPPSFVTLDESTSPILVTILLVLRCLSNIVFQGLTRWLQSSKRPPAPGDPSASPGTPEKPLAKTPTTLRPILPPELLELVVDFLFQPTPPTPDHSGSRSILSVKPSWSEVAGCMQASVGLHRMGFRRWMQIISVKTTEDWRIITDYIELIREIHCFDGTLLDLEYQHTLSNIPYLYAAKIDAHSDVWHDEHNRFAYRDVLSTLPNSLKRLEIEHAHGPDIKIISLVKRDCPKLEELILGRCTMFNRSPACDFWVSFPHDHDAYMSTTGTDSYAHSLANELAPLKYLRSLRVGLYFAPSNIVLAHRLYHRRGLPAPETIHWQSAIPLAELPANLVQQELPPIVELATTAQLVSLLHRRDAESSSEFKCPRCVETTDAAGKEAEKSANSILRDYIPTLLSIEWMGWLTPWHMGINSYRFTS